jgi:enoyl-CoA hydratase/carnithine racemase
VLSSETLAEFNSSRRVRGTAAARSGDPVGEGPGFIAGADVREFAQPETPRRRSNWCAAQRISIGSKP